ncbi:MAG: aspartate aminotransferase family protein [Rhodospirillales bacterium]
MTSKPVSPALMPAYARIDLAFDYGEGVYLVSTEGRRYLDFAAGIAVNALGHAHPRLVKALSDQAAKLWHVSNLFRIPEQEALAQRLAANSFADRAFFCNSGAEAIECGIKLVRKYFDDKGEPDRYRIVTCRGAFHGRTLSTISAVGSEKLTKGFGPLLKGFDQVDLNDLAAVEAAIGPETAAILVEPLQGEGGIRPAGADFLRALRALCDEKGLLLFFDEIQCGMGRTGRLFAHEWAGITPDIMALAKGIGGGFPVGACLATAEVGDHLSAGSHGTTYGGGPLAMAVAAAVLDEVLSDGFLARVEAVAKPLWAGLEALAARHASTIKAVRGAGLMAGIVCADDVLNTDVITVLRERGLITAPAADNVIRLLPPLIITEAHVAEALAILEDAFASLKEQAA